MRGPCTWQQGLRCLGALVLAVVGLDLRYGLGLAAIGGPLRFTLSGSSPAGLAQVPSTADPWASREPSCAPFELQLERLGDLEGESPVEAASSQRHLSLVELEDLRRQLRSGSHGLLQDRRAAVAEAARCHVTPEPTWELVINKTDLFPTDLRYRDTTSRYKVAVDVDLRPQPEVNGQHPAVALQPGPSKEDVFAALRNRWIYLHGDSTLRQVCCELVKFLSDIVYSFKEFKNIVRHQIDDFGIPAHSTAALSACIVQQPMDWEFWPGKCENITGCECDPYVGCAGGLCPNQPCDPSRPSGNDVTFAWYFSKLNLTVTFDWKAQALQRYDRWLLQRRFARRAPDVYISSTGMHDCFWPATRFHGPQYHRAQLSTLFDYMVAFLPNTTHVIWFPGQLSRSRLLARGYEECLQAVNGVAKEEAAARGFTFLDRDRILRSLVAYAEYHPDLWWYMDLDGVHFVDWVQLIIRQYLLSAFLCVLRP